MVQALSFESPVHSHPLPESAAIRTAALAACGFVDPAGATPDLLPTDMAAPDGLAVEVGISLEAARYDVLEAARRLALSQRRQYEARMGANDADNDWTVACFSSGATRDEMRRTNRARREARRAHEEAWHDYQAAAQQLCRAAEWMLQLEALDDVTRD